MSSSHRGLEGVIAGRTSLSFIDGKEGRLLYRGYDIRDLAEFANYEQVAYLLLNGDLPNGEQLRSFAKDLASRRSVANELLELGKRCGKASPMEGLRTLISAECSSDPGREYLSSDRLIDTAKNLVAKMATLAAAFHRIRNGEEAIMPSGALSHAANFLYMLDGRAPSEYNSKVFDTCLVVYADHGFNASTFAARITASTLSDLYSVTVAGIGTLKGPLHGSANQRVLEMIQEIGEASKAEEYVRKLLRQGQKIMGFGHRVYRTEDPRARILRVIAEELGRRAGDTTLFDIARKIEETAWKELKLYPNVEFYMGPVLRYLGIPADMFPVVFAVSRVVGWVSHGLEQYEDNRIIRPESEYIGQKPRPYVPLHKR